MPFENPFIFETNRGIKHVELQHSPQEITIQTDFVNYLKETFKVQPPERIVPSDKVILFLNDLLINYNKKFPEDLNILIEILRALRNSLACLESQKCIVKNKSALNNLKNLFEKCLDTKKEDVLHVVLQILYNLTSNNCFASETVNELFTECLQRSLVNNFDVYTVCAVLYNISLYRTINLQTLNELFKNYDAISENNEFISLFMERIFSKRWFWDNYNQLEVNSRINALKLIIALEILEKSHQIHDEGINILITNFLNSGEIIFRSDHDDIKNAHEVQSTLDVLCYMSHNESYLDKIQNKNLMIHCGALLINVHKLGKESENNFTPVQKLSDAMERNMENQPFYCFKRDLIRLIGNLCYKSSEMQDLVRTSELIPIILDCSNIDDRNPFILQWCILAIRNLCKNNSENQKVIAEMHKLGEVSSETLAQFNMKI